MLHAKPMTSLERRAIPVVIAFVVVAIAYVVVFIAQMAGLW